MPAKLLMIQGTSSHAGKSVLTAALCRLLHRQGVRVAPFKAMNMSNNAWVTRDGGEMAYAQAAQAWACGIEPDVRMNPVLLKTTSDQASQVVVLGRAREVVPASEFVHWRSELVPVIQDSLERLAAEYEVVIIEGAGSPAEVNLQETDLANMQVARAFDAPVILVGDIERGGLFAQIIGTLELLSPEDRDLVKGFLINKFRGDPSLLDSGLTWLEERTGKPVLGVIPYHSDIRVPEEDSLAERLMETSSRSKASPSNGSRIRVQILKYPTISNFDDFEPLHREPDLAVEYLTKPPAEGNLPDWLILPGSKSTMADLTWLRSVGLDRTVRRCVEAGVEVTGICGGFQMLGQWIYDPAHVESKESAMQGLGWLPTSTLFQETKVTAQIKGVHLESQQPVEGFEIHMGRVQGTRRGRPIFHLTDRAGSPIDELEGCRLVDKPIWGTYLHGFLGEPGFRRHLLSRFRQGKGNSSQSQGPSVDPYDAWADFVKEHLSLEKLRQVAPWMPLV